MAAAGARQAAMAPDGADSMKADVCGSSAMARRSSALYSISSWLRSTGLREEPWKVVCVVRAGARRGGLRWRSREMRSRLCFVTTIFILEKAILEKAILDQQGI
jgi:hypothetical protein